MKEIINNLFAAIDLINPLPCETFIECAESVASNLWIIAAPICTIMIIWGAFQMLTAAGDPEKIKTAKKTILYAAIGFGIVLLASGIPGLIKEILGG